MEDEVQSMIDSVNASIEGTNEVTEDILGNENEVAATSEQINAIDGVDGAREDVDYTSALQDATYEDPENPTVEEIQAVIDAVNRELDSNAAVPDKESGVSLKTPVTVNVLENDNLDRLDKDTIQIEGTKNPGDSLVVEGEGVWSIEDGKVVFTPEEGFVYDPTPIKYSLATLEGERLATAKVEVNYEGHVRDDVEVTSDLSKPVVIDVLKNDNGDLDVSSVEIVIPEGFMEEHEGAVFQKSAIRKSGKKLVVPNEGTWSVDDKDGNITFVKEIGLSKEPTPISYRVFDRAKDAYLEAGTITIRKAVVAGVNDTNGCQKSDSVPVLSKIGMTLTGILGALFGLFLFRKERK